MTRIFFLAIIGMAFSCTDITLIKQYNYRIQIDVWNGFAGYQSKYILNNLLIDLYDSTNSYGDIEKPFTLYYITHQQQKHPSNHNISVLVPVDTTEIAFSKELSDTLFILSRDFLKSVEFDNQEKAINGAITKPVIYDDSHAQVEMAYNGRKLIATISSISNPTIATKQLDTLLSFIGKFKPINR
jgi:hypothetical protein